MTKEIIKPEVHPKWWGAEFWVANSSDYCGKLLHFKKDTACSFHFHKLKKEHFFLHTGKIILKVSDNDDFKNSKTLVLLPGDAFYIYPGLRHAMIAVEDSDLFEFSTEHFEDDSYRVINGTDIKIEEIKNEIK